MESLQPHLPLVSIVIPAYNHAKYLLKAIESVTAQTYPSVEIIVINDGSTDSTAEILNHFNHPRVQIIHQANCGQAETLNRGWKLAKGEYLGYLSADDQLTPQAIETSVQVFKDNPEIILTYCDFELISPHSKKLYKIPTPDYNYYKMITRLECYPGPGVLFKKSCFLKLGGWDRSYVQIPDLEYWTRLGELGSFQRISQVLAYFRSHDGSMTAGVSTSVRAEEYARLGKSLIANNHTLQNNRKAARTCFAFSHLRTGQLHARAGRYLQAFKHFFQAVLAHPRILFSTLAHRILLNALINRYWKKVLWSRRLFAFSRIKNLGLSNH
ncbi:Glycosyltransferase [Planctomycetales bacterium 10988]|nr:Glycosyltransferase [Planctomycetales bacterium 10988]